MTINTPAEAAAEAEQPTGAATSAADGLNPAPGTPEPVAAPEPPTGATGDDEQDDDGRNPNAEAAKYRTQLRATEAERDGALEQVRELQQAYVELMVGPRLQNVDDFAKYVDPATLIADDGKLDRAKIDAAIDGLLQERPYLAAPVKRRPAGMPKERQGTPVQQGGGQAVQTLAEKFGGRTDMTWGSMLNKQGEHTHSTESGRSKVELEMHKE